MKQKLLIFLLIFTSFYACKNESAQQKQSSREDFIDLSRVSNEKIYFECANITQAQDKTPHHEVFIIIADNKTKVGEIEVCDILPPEQYAQHQIPAEAIQAIGGLNDNTYTFIYAVRDHNDRLLVRQGNFSPNQQQDSSYNYRTILTFDSRMLSTNPDFNPAQLAGVYGFEDGNHAWLLFISLSRQSLTAQLFELNSPLPEFDKIADALKAGDAIPELLRGFSVNPQNLRFQSQNGNGKFILPENGPATVVFENKKDRKGQPLTLKKMR